MPLEMQNGVAVPVPQVVIANTFHAVVQAAQYGSKRIIDLYFRTDAGGSSHTAGGLAQALMARIASSAMNLFATSVTFELVKVLDLRVLPYLEGIAAFPAGTVGSAQGEDAAPATAARASFGDGTVYKGGHPGLSLFGLVVGDYLNGLLIPAYVALAETVLNGLMIVGPDANGSSYDLANIHHKINKVVVNLSKPTASISIQPQTRTQRRRNVGKGA